MAPEIVTVHQPDDIGRAREATKRLAVEIGFDGTSCEEIAIVASELASNLIKHAQGGSLSLVAAGAGERVWIQIESQDHGPGIADVERALTDGFSTTGSLGYGLGTVNRLMDEVNITSQPWQGTHILCKRWLRMVPMTVETFPLEFGVATRPYPGMEVNGDAFVIKRWGNHALVGVIDGLGHGPLAHDAAEAARQFVETHYDQPLDVLFLGVSRTCHSTRGVVMALARFDVDLQVAGLPSIQSSQLQSEPKNQKPGFKLTFASIGNIEQRVLSELKPINFIIRRGVLGGSAPKAVVTEHPWDPASLLVLHSDGLRTHWRWEDFPGLVDQSAEEIARQLLRSLAKDEDDATVLVSKGAHAN